jgi:uncharacterized protein (TIGR01777 family)
MVRRSPRPEEGEIGWRPETGDLEVEALEGMDAVVHLAGENVAAGRWSPARKQGIFRSRVEGTRMLCEALRSLKRPPRVLICASAVGYYGHRGVEGLTEESPPGEGFLPKVCQAWEAAAEPALDAGIRVVHLRIGIVLSARGGALARMVGPFRLGLGGRVGDGRQGMSWIALEDLVGAIHHLLFDETLSGPVNGTAPNPVTQAEFARTLGKVLHRPTFFPMPATVVRLLFGEMGQALLLEGARVLPARLTGKNFPFLYPDLEDALRFELGCWQKERSEEDRRL